MSSSLDVITRGMSISQLLSGPPKINDQTGAVCRTLELPTRKAELDSVLGQAVELWYNGERWFVGFLAKKSSRSNGEITYTAYDPLYFLKRDTDDWVFKNITATQGFEQLAEDAGVRVKSLANTAVLFPILYYQGAPADKVATDFLARTYRANGRKFWYRYDPQDGAEGLILFERTLPSKIWAFQQGVNLISAEKEESLDNTATVVKLVNRETGKIVTQVDSSGLNQYGQLVHFEQVDKDDADKMESKSVELINKLKRITTDMKVEGVNPNRTMPQFFSGDAIYVEESNTQILGGYYIKNVETTFVSDDLLTLNFDVVATPDVPDIQYTDADTKADEIAKKQAKKAATAAKKAAKKKTAGSNSVAGNYSDEMKSVMDKYGITHN